MESGIDVSDSVSTTFKREDLERGFEPDECFYSSDNAEGVRDINVGPDAGDSLPDLVVEVDSTNPSLNKLSVYARLGVAEVWRFAGGKPEILALDESGQGYGAVERSGSLPILTKDALVRFVEEGLTTKRPDRVREWARQKPDQIREGE